VLTVLGSTNGSRASNVIDESTYRHGFHQGGQRSW
jgi:hypothetical protein